MAYQYPQQSYYPPPPAPYGGPPPPFLNVGGMPSGSPPVNGYAPQTYREPQPQSYYSPPTQPPHSPVPQQYYPPPPQPPPPQPHHHYHQQQAQYQQPSYQPPPQQQQYYQAAPPQQQYQAAPQRKFYYLGVEIPAPLPYPQSNNPGYNAQASVDRIRKATKGFGTDESALIDTLVPLNPFEVDAVSRGFKASTAKDLVAVLEKETSSWFRYGLTGISMGPLYWDLQLLHDALSGLGTKEQVLNEILLLRTNEEMDILKSAYSARYHQSLESKVKGDLSFKTERLFVMILTAARVPDNYPVDMNAVKADVQALYKAGQGKIGTDEITFFNIMVTRSTPHLAAISNMYFAQYRCKLTRAIKKEFSGHVKEALLFIAEGIKSNGYGHARRDAKLLEAAMAGFGTKDQNLVRRVVRIHWNASYLQQVKQQYYAKYSKPLATRVWGETSGDYRKMMHRMIGN